MAEVPDQSPQPLTGDFSRYVRETCPECDGKGCVLIDSMTLYGIPGGEDWDRCPACKGKGAVLVATVEAHDTELADAHAENERLWAFVQAYDARRQAVMAANGLAYQVAQKRLDDARDTIALAASSPATETPETGT